MTELAKVAARSAAEVCRGYKPGDDARPLLRDGLTPAEFLDALAAAGLDAEARRFLAQALPKREAVWWGVLGVSEFAEPVEPSQVETLKAARRWAADPSDANRRIAWDVAQAGELDNPSGLLAMAVFFSGDSLTPADLTPIAPPGYLAGDAVANALTLATVQKEPAKAGEKAAALLRIGLEVASGKAPPPDPEKGAKA